MKRKYLNYTVLIEQDEDGIYVAKVPDISGCYTQGKTVKEALERVREAIEVCLEAEQDRYAPLKFVSVEQVKIAQWQG